MMRNCFKRYDKANEFNNIAGGASGSTGAQNTNAMPGTQSNSMMPAGSSHQPQQLGTGNAQATSGAPSPLIKSGPHHKSQKSASNIMMNQQQIQNTYILPQTTQSRTLQYQQQQKLNLQLKSSQPGHMGASHHHHTQTHSINSKSTSNILQNGGIQQQVGSSTMAEKHGVKLSRPESGKKRTSFILHAQASQGQQPLQTQQYSIAGSQSLHLKHHGSISTTSGNNGGATGQHSMNHQYNASEPFSKGASATPSEVGGIGSGFVTSPPKRGGQTRKPSGKSTKSNRAALTKKQLITHSSHSIFPTATGNTTSGQPHHLHMQQPGTQPSPILAKMTQAASQQEQQQQKSSRDKITSASQPRQPSAGNILNSQQTTSGSQYMMNKNGIDYQRRGNSQQRGSQIKQSATPCGPSSHYRPPAGDTSTGNMLLKSNINNNSNGIMPSAQSQQQQSTESLHSSSNQKGSVEHGAVAAVVPQSTASNSSASKQSSTSSNTRPAAQQKFLPTIQTGQPAGGSTSSTTSSGGHHLNHQSQAMYAATSISPYHSVEEVQQNVPNQPNSNHMPQQANDYFILKQSQPTSAGAAMRSSTSQPNLHQNTANSIVQNNSNAKMHQSTSFVQQPGSNGVAPHGAGSSQAHQQMQNILGKGLRSQSEPPQQQLKPSDSAGSFMENLKQRATFSVVMKAAMLPKQPKRTGERTGTEAQLASESVKATVTKLLQKNQPQSTLPFFQTSKVSAKAFGSVKAFAANTNVGTVRKANEDRISIILNVIQPQQKSPRIPAEQWPKLQIFGVYDGHGGSKCAEYLKDNLHNNVILQPEFPSDIPAAIRKGSWKTEEDFLEIAAPSPEQSHNKAGSCAIVIFVVNEDIWILNVGDSRAIGSESLHPSDSFIHATASKALQGSTEQMPTPKMQMEATSNVRQLSDDHKPSCPREFKRITDAGGYIYQTQTVMRNGLPTTATQQVRQEEVPDPEDSDEEENPFVGPYRVFPGRLSVCRTFGDCEAKLTRLGGIQDVVTCEPEITHEVDGSNYIDYVLIGSDGIFDKMKNDQINEIIWDVTTKQRNLAHSQGQVPSIHTISGLVADEILHAAARARSLDNISVVFVAFQRFKEYIEMCHQEYVSPMPMPIPQPVNLQNEADDFFTQKVTPLRQEIMQTMKNNSGSGLATQPNHKDRNMIPKGGLHNQQFAMSSQGSNSKPGSHKASLIGANTPKSHLIEPTGDMTGSATPSKQNTYYINKLRQQDSSQNQQQQQQKQGGIRHSGMLENINRPSSRQGASRKGMRSRKANTTGLAPNTASHSQDSRPTLPQVQSHSTASASNKQGVNNTVAGKLTYNTLVDPQAKGSTMLSNSASASTLPSTVNQNALAGPGGQANVHASQQSSGHHKASAGASHQQTAQTVPGSRDGTVAHPSNARRGGLFKVNTQSHIMGAGNTGTQAGAGQHGLPDFMKQSSAHKSSATSQSQHDGSSHNHSRSSVNPAGGGSSSVSGSQARKKMKPYKSNQIRRMPDNPSNMPMKFVTAKQQTTAAAAEQQSSSSSPPAGMMQQQTTAAAGKPSINDKNSTNINNSSSHLQQYQHRF